MLRLLKWCSLNRLDVNVKKCFIISFNRFNNFIDFNYYLNETESCERVALIKDLGVIMDSKLTFNDHITFTIANANRSWSFIRRHSTRFNEVTIKILYYSLVKSQIMYGSSIWRPIYKNCIYRLEKVNHKFIRFLAFKSGSPMNIIDHSYSENALKFNVLTISLILTTIFMKQNLARE